MAPARAYLVESIPTGLEDLRGTPGVAYTGDILKRLTDGATCTIDLTAMYWNLLPNPLSADESGFTAAQFDAFGAGAGKALYEALQAAAARGVRIRILQGPGFGGPQQESADLREQHLDRVEVHQIDMRDWYGSGVMHQKIWVFDKKHIYLGAANMDWKSISQVKEMGVAVENCPQIANDATRYFNAWCMFKATPRRTAAVFDPAVQIWRKVPDWSELVPQAERKPSPLNDDEYSTAFNRENPLHVDLGGPAGVYITGCPREVCGPGRTYDGEALVQTILDAKESVCISVMDFAPVNFYAPGADDDPDLARHQNKQLLNTLVWWPDLFDALLHVVLTGKVHARLLVSKWAHTSPLIDPFLRALDQAAAAARADSTRATGRLEIRHFIVPGWASTIGAGRKYPGHTRVNHGKFIVTDRRINIGTSNMTWDYFAATAGSSFNTDHRDLVRDLQAVFDRDWNSNYAFPI